MGAYHAKLSPSSAHRWTECTASIAAQETYPNTGSAAARMGTVCHQIGEECLQSGGDPQGYLGWRMLFPSPTPEGKRVNEDWITKFPVDTPAEAVVEVTQGMVDATTAYVRFVRQVAESTGGEMIVEQQVPIGHITGEHDARGTADCIVLAGETLIVIDAKFGRGRVNAYDVVEPASLDPITGDPTPPRHRINLQAALYALGAYEQYGLLSDFKYVKAIIVQPFLNHVSEYSCEIAELQSVGDWLSAKAKDTRDNPEFKPNSDNCFFCRARFDCHARNTAAMSAALDGFEDVTTAKPKVVTNANLGDVYDKIDMIRQWCDDVEVKVMQELIACRTVRRADGVAYKLVEGKKPAKAWDDANVVEKMLHDMRFKDELIYTRKLITPSQAEKLAEKKGKKQEAETETKKPIGKINWSKLEEHITQGRGKPTIAPKTDPRPEFSVLDEGFDDEPIHNPN